MTKPNSDDKKPANVDLDQLVVDLPATITVGALAKQANLSAAKIVMILLKNGIIATINDSIDYETVEIIADELGIKVKKQTNEGTTTIVDQGKLQTRPPVVTILGHVDHGKTTLLDAIRKSDIAASESGGITQHIGAYHIFHQNKDGPKRAIVFLDTPGHEAFSALRAHGASVTDIAILVVAADEGVKPQTKEALSHAKAANVPIIVAITKIDKPEANLDMVKSQLVEIGLNPEDWGGKTPTIGVSAKTKIGIDELLDLIILVADLNDLKATYDAQASGVVIESHKQKGIGPVATLLVQNGTLHIGDPIVIGRVSGKIRLMEDEHGKRIIEASPSMPAKIAGLTDIPEFGSKFMVVEDEKQAKIKAQWHNQTSKVRAKSNINKTADQEQEENGPKQLPLILKSDVDGSLKAINSALESLSSENSVVKIIFEGIGDITESDVHMAIASGAMLIGFRVGTTPVAKNLARQHKVTFNTYQVIYNLIDDVRAALEGMLEIAIVETEVGRLKVLKIFRTTKKFIIAGGRVEQGKIIKNTQIQIKRDDQIIGKGKLTSLKQGQVDVDQVEQGNEAGLGLETNTKILVGDVLIAFIQEEKVVRK